MSTPQVTETHRALARSIEIWVKQDGVGPDFIAGQLAELTAITPCPNVVCGGEGSQYCALAESTVRKLTEQRDTRLNAIVALMAACEEVDEVLVHVAARPHVRQRLQAVMQQVRNGGLMDEVKTLREDKARLDWLDSKGAPKLPWIARESAIGRGYRLHQDKVCAGHGTPRDAIDAARKGGAS